MILYSLAKIAGKAVRSGRRESKIYARYRIVPLLAHGEDNNPLAFVQFCPQTYRPPKIRISVGYIFEISAGYSKTLQLFVVVSH